MKFPLALRHPAMWLCRLLRVAPYVAAGLLLAAFLVQRETIVVERTRVVALDAELLAFRRLATDATVAAAADGTRPLLSTADAQAALAGALRDRDDARTTLARIDRDTRAARTRSTASDAALTRAQADNARSYARAAPRIAELATAEPTGTAGGDREAIDEDSKAAWEAWR